MPKDKVYSEELANEIVTTKSEASELPVEIQDRERRALVEKALKVGFASSVMLTVFSGRVAAASFPPPPGPPPSPP